MTKYPDEEKVTNDDRVAHLKGGKLTLCLIPMGKGWHIAGSALPVCKRCIGNVGV